MNIIYHEYKCHPLQFIQLKVGSTDCVSKQQPDLLSLGGYVGESSPLACFKEIAKLTCKDLNDLVGTFDPKVTPR